MADQDPNQDCQDRNLEVPGDTNSADIVDRTGEQMPSQSHDGLEDQRKRDAAEAFVALRPRSYSPRDRTACRGIDRSGQL